jgi:hypothetical protein
MRRKLGVSCDVGGELHAFGNLRIGRDNATAPTVSSSSGEAVIYVNDDGDLTAKVDSNTEKYVVLSTDNEGKISTFKHTIHQITTATRTLTTAESGQIFLLAKADGIAITLPTVSGTDSGVTYEFINDTALTSDVTITSSSNNIIGLSTTAEVTSASAADSMGSTAVDTVTFANASDSKGDRVVITTDGTHWYAYASTKLAAAVTFA